LIPTIAIALLVSACSGGDNSGPDAGPPAAELGTGTREFEELLAAGDVFVIQGPQGGFHLLGSVRVSGIMPGDPDDLGARDNPTTEFRVLRAGTRVDAMASRYVQGLDPIPGGGGHEMLGRLVILDIVADDELDGDTIDFSVTVTDVTGVTVTASLSLVARSHPQNPAR